MAGAQNGMAVQALVSEASRAIFTLLRDGNFQSRLQANAWLASVSNHPQAWPITVALALQSYDSGQQDVQFFALNMLLHEVRSDRQIPEEQSAEVYYQLLEALPKAGSELIRARMSVLLGAIAAVSGAEACYELVDTTINTKQLGGPSSLAVTVLTSLAEETILRSRTHEWEVVEAVQRSSSDVLKFLWHFVSSAADPADVAKGFMCLDRWQSAGITLSELHSEYPSFLAALLESLKADNPVMFDAAVTVLVDLVREVDLLPARESAVRTVLSGLLAARSQDGSSKHAHAYDLCSLAAAIGSAEAAFICKGGPESLALVEWLVDATAGNAGGLGFEGAELALEVWPRVAAIPRSKRVPQFQVPLFEGVLQAIVRVSSFPTDFTIWDSSDLEQDDFSHFREGSVVESLIACHKEIGTPILRHITSIIHQGATWQLKEVGLYVAKTISPGVCTAAMGVGMNSPLGEGGEGSEQVVSLEFVTSLFEGLPRTAEGAPLHPLVASAACQTIEAYAPIAANDTHLFELGVTYAVTALSLQEARGPAAAALRSLCTLGVPRLASFHPDALAPLMAACQHAASVMSSDGVEKLKIDDRVALAEAMAAVGGALPQFHSEDAIQQLAGPVLTGLRQLAGGKPSSSEARLALVNDLKLLSAITGASNPVPGRTHPALPMLQDAWPVLDTLAVNWAQDSAVAAAICGLWATVARNVGTILLPVALDVVDKVLSMYRKHLEPAALDCLTEIIILHGTSASAELQLALSSTLGDIQSSLPLLLSALVASEGSQASESNGLDRHGPRLAKDPLEALRAVFQLARTFLRCMPRVLLPQPAIVQLFQCAAQCLRRSETEPTVSAAVFLTEAISGSPSASIRQPGEQNWVLPQDMRTYIDAAVGQFGPQLVDELLTAVVSSTRPAVLLEPLAEFLYALRCQYREATQAAVSTALRSPLFPARPGTLTGVEKQQFLMALLREPPHAKRRFAELVLDFSKLCKGQAPAEVLQSY